MTDIATRRLHTQRLTGAKFESARDAVRWLGAVQSQDYAGAKWALGQRTRGSTEAEIDRLFDEGAILRTHVLRPTWHFVLPDDIRWLLALTGPRVSLGLAGRYRQLGIDQEVIARASEAFAAALAGGQQLTRVELGEVLSRVGISPEGQRLPHLIGAAELDGLIASGARRGRQHTYALLEERAPATRTLDRTEALAELATRYFRSHGPAQVGDFAWWSGLTLADARRGAELAAETLSHAVLDGEDHWFDHTAGRPARATGVVHLLPNFDEYTVAYRDRSAILHADSTFEPSFFSFGSVLSNIVTVGGRVRGAWRRTATRDGGLRVEVRTPDQLDPDEVEGVGAAARRLARFQDRPVELAWL